MATFTVTTASDIIDENDGLISLREALIEANLASDNDTIVFDGSLQGSTITLSHDVGYGALTISENVVINGDTNADNKADITIDADRHDGSLLEVDYHSAIEVTGGQVSLKSLTITGGRALSGGGIDVASGAELSVEFSTVSGNYASSNGTETDVAGAGIANAGVLTLSNSVVYDNFAMAGLGQDAIGGGVYNTGTLTISNSTFAENIARGGAGDFMGGTAAGAALGAAIGNVGGDITILNSTITGNVAQYETTSSLFGGSGSSTLTSIGGVYSGAGTVDVSNSILLGNVSGKANNEITASEASSGITYSDLNIVGIGVDRDASDNVVQVQLAALVFDTAVNAGQALAVAGQLADNGGAVMTVKLNDDRLNSALDAAGIAATSNDARSVANYDDANISDRDGSSRDLGAYELNADTPENAAPTITGDLTGTVNEGATYYINRNDLYGADVDVLDDEQNITFTVSGLSNGVVKLNGTVATTFTAYEVRTGQVSFVHNGTETVTAGFDVVVEDGNEDNSNPISSRFNFSVNAINDRPVLNKLVADVKLPVHTDWSFAVANNFKDADSTLTFSAKLNSGAVLPSWIKISANGEFTLTPTDTVYGTFAIKVAAKDASGATVYDSFNIIVPKKPGLTSGADNGADKITGSSSANIINAGNGTNIVNSGAGNDKIYTGSGVDTINAGTGNDYGSLGAGNDTAKLGDGDDRFYGESGDDNISGGNGNDTIYDGQGNDKLYGDAGNDTLLGEFGNDKLYGGAGDDYLSDNEGVNFLYGNAGVDRIYGGRDIDTIYGGTENDWLSGHNGNDKIYGEAGLDYISGGNGNDIIVGGQGNDTLEGGYQYDKFKFALGTLDGIDAIRDFSVGSDKIVLPVGISGADLVAFGDVQDANDKLIYDQVTGDLYFDNDANGTGVAVKFATLSTKPALTISDFLFE